VIALVLALPAFAAAHSRSVSYSSWTMGPAGAHVELRLSALDATLTGIDPFADTDALGRYVTERLAARSAGRPCRAGDARATAAADGFVLVAWDVACEGPPDAIVTRLFADVAPSHLHFARIVDDGGVTERVLADDRAGRSSTGGDGRLAVLHGLRAPRRRPHPAPATTTWRSCWRRCCSPALAEVATIVTIVHRRAQRDACRRRPGLVHPDARGVEALIGFSIALSRRRKRLALWPARSRDDVARHCALLAAAFAPGAVSTITLLSSRSSRRATSACSHEATARSGSAR
jgi:hypothetical protein